MSVRFSMVEALEARSLLSSVTAGSEFPIGSAGNYWGYGT